MRATTTSVGWPTSVGSAVATGAPVAAGRWVGPGCGRRGVAPAAAVLLLGAGLVSSCATGGGSPEGAAQGTSRPLLAPAGSSPTLAPPPSVPVPPTSLDGALPQTGQFPSSASSTFRAQMAYLWQAVVSGDPVVALPAFFPLAAYRQVKTVPDPATDWGGRLRGGFALDIQAAHDLLGPAAAGATLMGVEVPAGHARWVRPGSCANRVGYWHVAGARVLYRSGGAVRSFGIKSLISWRGNWYVVHLGAVVHPAPHGQVDQPASGRGSLGAAGGC